MKAKNKWLQFTKIVLCILGITLGIYAISWLLGGAFNHSKNGISIKAITNNDQAINLNVLPKKYPKKNPNVKDPQIFAKTAYLIDGTSFYPLYSKREDEKVPIASTTKMATAITVLENYPDKLNDTVTITSKMINVEGSDIKLRPGEKITVENLLNGLLIMSGNDTAYSLAEYFGGKEKFVLEMNKKVEEIGLKNTHYKDPAGLDDDGYSTAKDLAILAAYNLKNSKFATIVKTTEKTVYSTDGKIAHELKNSNRLIHTDEPYYLPYAIGVKTGFTYGAGHALVSAGQKDGKLLISVVLNTNENTITASAKESKKLLEWGFNSWTW